MVPAQHGAAGLDRCEHAVRNSSGLHLGHKVADHLIPDQPFHSGMGFMVSDNLNVALADGHEQQDAVALATARVSCGELAMRQLARMRALDSSGTSRKRIGIQSKNAARTPRMRTWNIKANRACTAGRITIRSPVSSSAPSAAPRSGYIE